MGIDGCRLMCCDRGYRTEKYIAQTRCSCTFKWCCEVHCKVCPEEKVRHICNWQQWCIMVQFNSFQRLLIPPLPVTYLPNWIVSSQIVTHSLQYDILLNFDHCLEYVGFSLGNRELCSLQLKLSNTHSK